MARFRGTVQGQRGEASRLGDRGLSVAANGWDVGVEVDARPKPLDEERNMIVVRATGGSHDAIRVVELGTLVELENGSVVFRLSEWLAGELDPQYHSATVREAVV